MSRSSHLTGTLRKGLLFVVSAPAGTGKTTLVQQLVRRAPSVVESVSYTTRPPRLGEEEGVHYHFIDKATFQEKVAAGDFLEYVELYGYHYGTSSSWVNEKLASGKHVILVIDTQGALKLMDRKIAASYIFILPPSLEILRQRLELRRTESPSVIEERLAWARSELAAAPRYDYLIVNDTLTVAGDVLYSIIVAEEHLCLHRQQSKNFSAALQTLLS